VKHQQTLVPFTAKHWPLRGWPLLLGCLGLIIPVALLQFVFPALEQTSFSPINMLLACGVGVSLINAATQFSLDRGSPGNARYWLVVVSALLAIVAAQLIDVGSDEIATFWHLGSTDNVPEVILFAAAFASLMLAPILVVRHTSLTFGLLALSAFGFVTVLPEAFGEGSRLPFGLSESTFDVIAQFCGLMCLAAFMIATLVPSHNARTSWHRTDLIDGTLPVVNGSFVGTRSRQMFLSGRVPLSPRHPPIAIAFRPGFQDVAFYLAMMGMLIWAARPIKRGTGKGYLQQAGDMTRLWFNHRIDPPTYYSLDLYRSDHANWIPHLLTRFETKNGLLSALNRRRANPRAGHEMNDKQLFAQACLENGIAHPQPLMMVDKISIKRLTEIANLEQGLFCKPRKTMGAKDTLAFKWLGNGIYQDAEGQTLDMVAICARLALKGKAMLVQPWLRNHKELGGFAKDSLIAIRVVTVLNAEDEPEVTLAMMRLLSKLEPDWQHLPDGEYASPINLETGEMGLFTGDNFKTALVRMTHHPVTGAAINGVKLKNWPAVSELALKAHRCFKHRVVVGWDIALTPDGPVVIEGNTNLDVMFLQRVHHCPAGDTRFGELLNYQIQQFHAACAVA
jgi:hypothetical protein